MPFVGQVVHYKPTAAEKLVMLAAGNNAPDILPGVLTQNFGSGLYPDANLKVFLDGPSADLLKQTCKRGTAEGQWDYIPA